MPSSSHQNASSKRSASRVRFGLELPVAMVAAADAPCAARERQLLGGEHIALHLRKRDVALGELSVGMEDRVVRILPALIGEPCSVSALIFDKAVLVGIAGAVDPCERGLDRGPQLALSVSSSPVRST